MIHVFPLGPLGTNLVCIGCPTTKKAAIFDAPEGSFLLLKEKIPLWGWTPEALLLTHSHWDHIVDAALIQNHFQIPLYVHPEDRQNVEHPGTDGLPFPLSIPPARVDQAIEEGRKISIGQLVFEVIHTPGHAPGCVCYYLRKEGILVSGDTLFKGGIGNINLPTSEPERMRPSLNKLEALPPETKVIPGHGKNTTIGDEL